MKAKADEGGALPLAPKSPTAFAWCASCGHLDTCHLPGRCIGLKPLPGDDWAKCECTSWCPGYDEMAREMGYEDESGEVPADPCHFCDRPGGFTTPGGHLLCVRHEEVYWRHVNSKLDAARGK